MPEPDPEPESAVEIGALITELFAEEPADPFSDESLPSHLAEGPDQVENFSEPPEASRILMIWGALGVLVAVLVGVVFLGQSLIVKQFPQAKPFYESLGYVYEGPLDGLEIIDVTSTEAIESGSRVLVVQGKIANRHPKIRNLPALKAALVDKQGIRLAEWVIVVEETTLEPQMETSFREVLIDPDKNAARVVVAFDGVNPSTPVVEKPSEPQPQAEKAGSTPTKNAKPDPAKKVSQGH